MKTAALLSLLSLVWCVAVLIKLAGCRSRREPYTFSQWDGGLMLRGQTIGRVGTTVLGVFCVVCGGGAAYLLSHAGHAL